MSQDVFFSFIEIQRKATIVIFMKLSSLLLPFYTVTVSGDLSVARVLLIVAWKRPKKRWCTPTGSHQKCSEIVSPMVNLVMLLFGITPKKGKAMLVYHVCTTYGSLCNMQWVEDSWHHTCNLMSMFFHLAKTKDKGEETKKMTFSKSCREYYQGLHKGLSKSYEIALVCCLNILCPESLSCVTVQHLTHFPMTQTSILRLKRTFNYLSLMSSIHGCFVCILCYISLYLFECTLLNLDLSAWAL